MEKLSEFKNYDKSNLFDGKGFIYIFLSEDENGFIPNVQFCPSEPDTLIDDFNAGFEDLGDVETEFSIDFFEADNAEDGTRIFVESGDEITLLQYDPLDDGMPEFLAETEKIAHFRMKLADLKALDFSRVELSIE